MSLFLVFEIIPERLGQLPSFDYSFDILFHIFACLYHTFYIIFDSLDHFPSLVFQLLFDVHSLLLFIIFEFLLAFSLFLLVSPADRLSGNFNLLGISS